VKTLAGLGILLSLGLGLMPRQSNPRLMRLSFPSLQLDSQAGETITSLAVDMACGRFRQVTIPNDWSLEVLSPMSERTTLRASAGHGSTELRRVPDLDGIVSISIGAENCFDISAVVVTETLNEQHRHAFTREQLTLKE